MDHPVNHFENDLVAALSSNVKHISPKYFYDVQGSVLFDQICDLPEYYPTRTEMSILSENSKAIAQHIGPQAELIELGAGSLTKVRVLLRQLELPTLYGIKENPLPWLQAMLSGVEHANFFEARSTEYSKAATRGQWHGNGGVWTEFDQLMAKRAENTLPAE